MRGGRAREPLPGADLCVHCGFCLQACPTYLTLDDENDSPRGRIVLMQALAKGMLSSADDAVATHLDQCLGCRACETVCPSGVPYGQLLEATRAAMATVRPIPWTSRLILATFARPWLLALAMAGGRAVRSLRLSRLLARAPGRLGLMMATLEATRRDANEVARGIGSVAGADRATSADRATRGRVAVEFDVALVGERRKLLDIEEILGLEMAIELLMAHVDRRSLP